jgi:hypothetical protein
MDIIIMSAHKFTLQLDIHGPASTDALQLMCFNHFDRRNRPLGPILSHWRRKYKLGQTKQILP